MSIPQIQTELIILDNFPDPTNYTSWEVYANDVHTFLTKMGVFTEKEIEFKIELNNIIKALNIDINTINENSVLMDQLKIEILQKVEEAKNSAENAKNSEIAAKTSEQNAKQSEQNAKISEQNAKESEELAKQYAQSSDARNALLKQNNLSDLTNVEVARNNLNVFSKEEAKNWENLEKPTNIAYMTGLLENGKVQIIPPTKDANLIDHNSVYFVDHTWSNVPFSYGYLETYIIGTDKYQNIKDVQNPRILERHSNNNGGTIFSDWREIGTETYYTKQEVQQLLAGLGFINVGEYLIKECSYFGLSQINVETIISLTFKEGNLNLDIVNGFLVPIAGKYKLEVSGYLYTSYSSAIYLRIKQNNVTRQNSSVSNNVFFSFVLDLTCTKSDLINIAMYGNRGTDLNAKQIICKLTRIE